MQTNPKLPTRLVAAYGTGQAAEGIANYLLTALLLFYYTSILGLAGSIAGVVLMIGLIFDAVTDPVVAVLSDRTRSRWGRRHPYLLASALPLGAGLVLAFRPPAFIDEQFELGLWLLGTVVGIRAAITLFHVPHMALGAELTLDYDERTRVVSARSIAAVIGTAVIVVSYFMLVSEFESPDYADPRLNPTPYKLHSAMAGIAAALAVLVSTFGTRSAIPRLSEPLATDGDASVGSRALRDFGEAVRLPTFRALVVGFTLCSLSWGFSSALQTHLALYFWHVSIEIQGLQGMGIMIGIGFGMRYWQRVAETRDKQPAFVTGMAWYTAFAALGPFLKVMGWLPAESSPLYGPAYACLAAASAFSVASMMVLSGSMMGDITDEDELESGQRREGVFFGAYSFATKVANGVGAAVGGIVYDAVGLTQGAPADAATTPAGIQLGIASALLIVVFVGAGVLAFRRYDLDRARHREIRRALDARAEGVPLG